MKKIKELLKIPEYQSTGISMMTDAAMLVAVMWILLNSIAWAVCIGLCIMIVLSHTTNK